MLEKIEDTNSIYIEIYINILFWNFIFLIFYIF